MTGAPSQRDSALGREILIITAFTLLGAFIRLWSPGRLGLVHFDEGIYALAGLWIHAPAGLSRIDPGLIPYAPPGYPVLVGLAYWFLGTSDTAATAVSVATGTLTIPAAGWLAYRSFGRGAGAAASALAALSGPHIAFSRMALTDASFLLCWTIAIVQGQRFLERPCPLRALVLGLAVGAAQLLKYNGWLPGALTALSATAWVFVDRSAGATKTLLATWGWGLVTAAVAAALYWPWFQFVESHGGYSALMAHHRGYMSGISAWPAQLAAQLAQAKVLSGGIIWQVTTGLAAAAAMELARNRAVERRRLSRAVLLGGALGLFSASELAGLAALFILLIIHFGSGGVITKSIAHLAVALISLLALTPFYHPYARLWLPISSLGWILAAGTYAAARSRLAGEAGTATSELAEQRAPALVWSIALVCVISFALRLWPGNAHREGRIWSLLAPTDSLRNACRTIALAIPKNVESLRLLGRPPITFYLGGHVSIIPQPDARGLSAGKPGSWAVLDKAVVWAEPRGRAGPAALEGSWVVVREVPTELSLPTMLDIDPSAARSGHWDNEAPLYLLRRAR
jgi:4-amino-4-deoxy-L-arabinose transferase-like glycosyltransferase